MKTYTNNEYIKEQIKGKEYAFCISSASFEDRSTGIAEIDVASISQIDQFITFVNACLQNGKMHENKNYNYCTLNNDSVCSKYTNNIRILEEYYKSNSLNYNIIINALYDNQKQIEALNNLIDMIDNIYYRNSEFNILIDISCFTRNSLISMLYILRTYYCKSNIDIIYFTPKEYDPRNKKVKRLTFPPYEVRTFMFSGDLYKINKPTRLIIFPGYEIERSMSVIDAYAPQEIFFIYSKKGVTRKHYKNSVDATNFFINKYKNSPCTKCAKYEISNSDINECFNDLNNIIIDHKDNFNIVLCSFDTKLTVISTYLVYEKQPSITLCYSIPKEYNCKDYSVGIKDFYYSKLPHILNNE